jgi:patatin-like phospholipase/acyl hydrolase
MKINTKDEIVQSVLKKMDERSLVGQKKYGATMMEEIKGEKKDLYRFMVDIQEEMMDSILYLEAAKRCLTNEIEEAMIRRSNTSQEFEGHHNED